MNTCEISITGMDSNGNAYELEFTPTPIIGETWYQYPYLLPLPTFCYSKPTQWCPDFKRKKPIIVTGIDSGGNKFERKYARTPLTYEDFEVWAQYPYLERQQGNLHYHGEFINLQAQPKRKEPEMRGLFEVYVVNPETSTVVDSVKIVAKSPETAKLKAIQKHGCIAGDLDDYDFIVHKLGDVRAKKMVQEVRVVTNVMRDLEIARDLLK